MSRSTGHISSHPTEPGPVSVTPFGEQRFSSTGCAPETGFRVWQGSIVQPNAPGASASSKTDGDSLHGGPLKGGLRGRSGAAAQGLDEQIKVASRLSSGLSNYRMDQNEEIRRSFEELVGKPVEESFHLIPPFFTDYGLNITVGPALFLGPRLCVHWSCSYHHRGRGHDRPQGQHGDGRSPRRPDIRHRYITAAPIKVETNVWIGAALRPSCPE